MFNQIFPKISLSRLTGPILDKELRVSSRRRRNYTLRFAYLALLLIFVIFMWLEEVGSGGSALYRISRMAQAGEYIIATIVWFQFCALQLVAIVMLSNAISDEIYHKTLGTLMTTPISSFQIVMGKLFSKLTQLLLLMAITLPLLAIIRVFGGVPWNYVFISLGVTFTTVLFVGSLSLFFSIFCRRSYVVIILTLLTLGVIFFLLPLLVVLIYEVMEWYRGTGGDTILTILLTPNPYGIMGYNTAIMMEPSVGGPALSTILHIAIMLTASALLLAISIRMVRKVALRQATGQAIFGSRNRRSKKQISPTQDLSPLPQDRCRPVRGMPVVTVPLYR